jgi:hypothetical protein
MWPNVFSLAVHRYVDPAADIFGPAMIYWERFGEELECADCRP